MNRLHQALAKTQGRPLLGAALYFYDPAFLEIAIHMGFDVVWIEMEHGHITFAEAADLCRMAAGRGVLTFIRICDTRRENILKALECGPDILDVPMVDTADTARELVHFAHFPPHGARGAFSISRALNYGFVDNLPAAQQRLNEDVSLLVQIETKEALENLEDIAAVPGVDLFVGPSDLAASLGHTGQTGHADVRAACVRILQVARKHNKKVATMCPPADFDFWLEQGVDMIFVVNDITALKTGAKLALDAVHHAIDKRNASADTTR